MTQAAPTTPNKRLHPFLVPLVLSLGVLSLVAFGWMTGERPEAIAKGATKTTSPVPKGWMKGMTVSCYGWGAAWGTPMMRYTMARLKKLGVNWVSYHPYASIRGDGSLRYSRSLSQRTVLSPLRYGKKLGVKTLLKPHIGYWGSKFSWRGSITFADEASWQRFFRHYTDWIVIQAKMAQKGKADLFSVGVEYIKTLHREKDWRKVIKAVRKVYKGKITYSANWDSYTKVRFWDALDYIGIQAYFPLTKQPNPSEATLDKAWDKLLPKLKAYAKKHKRSIIFTELGYNRASHAAARPWDHAEGGPYAEQIKRRCIKVALRRLHKEPYIKGVFLWKWFPSPWSDASNYTLQYPKMKKTIRAIWGP